MFTVSVTKISHQLMLKDVHAIVMEDTCNTAKKVKALKYDLFPRLTSELERYLFYF